MIHIHPFPARMAPEIALDGLSRLPKDYLILDPMSGSGMVIGLAAKLGLKSIGYDLDPLACMISKANGTLVIEEKVRRACRDLISKCLALKMKDIYLPWIDDDQETSNFISFWFGPKQIEQLRRLSFLLVQKPILKDDKISRIIKVAISRLIITKEPKASFARDTAHSRPHRTITENDFDVIGALVDSLDHVLRALSSKDIKVDASSYRGDARSMGRVRSESIDCIVTSPPYLNAIDYMRGHKLSLVWLGYRSSELRQIRSRSVGAEISGGRRISPAVKEFFDALDSDVVESKRAILRKYYADLCGMTNEAARVLKKGRMATYVMGNSSIRGHEIDNSELLVQAANQSGLRLVSRVIRDIPENRRYMPLKNSVASPLSKRMRNEHIVVFQRS